MDPRDELKMLRRLAELEAKAAGGSVAPAAPVDPVPGGDPGAMGALAIGAGKATDSILDGITQLYLKATGDSKALGGLKQNLVEKAALYRPLQEARPIATAIGEAAPGMVVPVGGAATGVKALALAGAKGGAAGAAMQPVLNTDDFWTQKATQAGVGAVTGAIATPLLAKAAEGVAKGANAITRRPQMVDSKQVNIATTNIFGSEGIDPAKVPEVILRSVSRQAEEALKAGQKLDPKAMIRKAQFEAVGLTDEAAPTLGQATRDSMQFANEKNLSGVRIKTPQGEGNPLADRFAAQNRRLQDVFDQAGASGATDRVTAGQTLISALRRSDVPAKGGVDEAYDAARAMNNGRAAPLERGTFSQNANIALEQGQWGRFLPDNVRGLLNDITEGKTPFDVDAAVQIDSILSAAQRKAGKGSPEASAIGVVRDSLRDTPMQATEFADNGAGQMARDAFDQARAAARSRFATIEQTPALKAALDDAAPDKFVQQFVVGADVRDVQALRKVLENSPEALGQARAQIADTLKRAAFGGNVSGDAGFAPVRYDNVLKAIGRQKLEVFFSPSEIVRMNLAGKVASDISSIPAGAKYAVNHSGTGAAVMNLLSKLSEVPMLRQVPGARMVANQIGEIQTERAINQALRAPLPDQAPKLSPEQVRAIQRLFAPAGVGAGILAGSSAQ
jgi:hypothetical protein